MQITRDLVLPGPPERAYAFVDDLQQYPPWMTLIHEVAPAPPSAGDPPGTSAWTVELRAQVGPLARSKQLRMVRTIHEPPTSVCFERIEVDGRSHAPWTPTFDEQDDLDGLLSARSPLLARAFRGDDRPRSK